jgi:hypothetical protein
MLKSNRSKFALAELYWRSRLTRKRVYNNTVFITYDPELISIILVRYWMPLRMSVVLDDITTLSNTSNLPLSLGWLEENS